MTAKLNLFTFFLKLKSKFQRVGIFRYILEIFYLTFQLMIVALSASPIERFQSTIIKHTRFNKIFDGKSCCFCTFQTFDLVIEPLIVRVRICVRPHVQFILQKFPFNDQLQITTFEICIKNKLRFRRNYFALICAEYYVLRLLHGDRMSPLSTIGIPCYLPTLLNFLGGSSLDLRSNVERSIVELNEFYFIAGIETFLILHLFILQKHQQSSCKAFRYDGVSLSLASVLFS